MSSTSQQPHDISIRHLRSELNGEVIGPDDAAYDEARQVIFKGVDRRPAAVARVVGAVDVARVITLARESASSSPSAAAATAARATGPAKAGS